MVPPSRSDSPRDRVIEAATVEFARHGISGARIDRIAKSAKTSKERVYAYFRSKEALYGFVLARELAAIAEATPMDTADLPEYAGRVHDYFVAHPDKLRLMRWGQLEAGGADADRATQDAVARKTAQLRSAQQAGLLDSSWDPLDILVFLNQLAMSWAGQAGVAAMSDGARERFLAARRSAIVAAVERLFPAGPAGLRRRSR